MVTTCRDVVTAAYQDADILADDESAVPEQADRGLRLLQDLYRGFVVRGAFGRFSPRLITDDYTAEEGERVAYTGATSATVTLPTTVDNSESPEPVYGEEGVFSSSAAVDDANRAPRDLSVVEVAGTTPATFLYDAQIGDWVDIEGLTLNSTAPLTPRFRGELTAMLAEKVARKPVFAELRRAAVLARATIFANPSAPRRAATPQFY